MGIDIRLPNITASTTEGQMSQMQSYMHQLVEQLNWALTSVDNAIQGNTANVSVASQKGQNSEEDAINTFNSIKALIIKSADIVHAYEESMRTEYNGEYIAVSDFGTYLQETNRIVEDNSHYAEDQFSNLQAIAYSIEGTLDKVATDVYDTNTYIRRGELGTYQDGELKGQMANGIAVGETVEFNGEPLFKGYAWFTAKRLSFFDDEGHEVAYISNRRLNITEAAFVNATFASSVRFGNYKVDPSDGLAFTWIGG